MFRYKKTLINTVIISSFLAVFFSSIEWLNFHCSDMEKTFMSTVIIYFLAVLFLSIEWLNFPLFRYEKTFINTVIIFSFLAVLFH